MKQRSIPSVLPVLYVLLAGGVLLPGCGAASQETETIEFWAMGREGEVVQELIPGFERQHPGIRVKVQQMPWTAAHEKLLTAFAGDAMPDLCQLGNTWIPEFVALNALENLDPWIARSGAIDREDYFSGIWETNRMGNHVYGLPWYVDTRVLFYRKDLLQNAGYETMPDTWEGWVEAMRAVKRQTGDDGYAILLPVNEWAQPLILGQQAGAVFLKDGDRYGDFSGEAFREAFTFYVNLFREGLAPSLSTTQISNLYQEFSRGYFSMYITGPWNVGEFKRRVPPELQDAWMTAPLPGPDTPGVSLAGGSSLALFRSSEHPEAAWKLMTYLSAPEQQAAFYRLTGNLPARKQAWKDTTLAGDPYMQAFFEQLSRVQPMPKVPEWERISTRVLEYAEAAVRGQLTIDQALARLDQDVDQILEKRRWMLRRQEEES